ncbi:MAG: methylisocitrate lyase [Deltaproteobacteria bacterium]|nr:methylisocitrate lyase [Deltaproteobacteria bacterium]
MTLKELLERKEIIVAPGAFNAASAMLIEKAGFPAFYISGAGLSNSNGLPDAGILTLEEVVRLTSYITGAVSIPAIIDADTGFGGPAEVRAAVKALEAAGASGVQLEDQEWPKRCGHLPGKKVIPAPEFAEKIRAAVEARSKPGFRIIARTDARAVEGLGAAVARARLYAEAGADVIFPEALESKEEFAEFSREVKAPLMANMTEFGKTPYLGVDEFREMGYAIVIFPMTCFRAAMKAMEEALSELKERGTQKGMLERMQTREELYRMLRYSGEEKPPEPPENE